MGFAETVALGAIAGLTIYVGLPLGRIRAVDDRMRVRLAMFSVGILAFIFMDVTKHGEAILETTLDQLQGAHRELRPRARPVCAARARVHGRHGRHLGPREAPASAPQPARAGRRRRRHRGGRRARRQAKSSEDARKHALQTGMVIATAIGLHNFAEGLAIGVSAKAGAIGLATVLIIGFGLHNATEGFGIVGPLGGARPSWTWLGLAGLVGGGPTFLGTIVGYQVNSQPLELMFYALAGGAILYVIGEIWTGMRRYGHHTLGLYMIAAGFLAGVATDLIVSYGGG